jgi:hypothetical protein
MNKLRNLRCAAILAAVLFMCCSCAVAQDAVPVEILERTLYVRVGNEGGTAFKIDHQGKVYLVTARHVVAGLPPSNATIKVWRADKWEDLKTVKTFFPPSQDADIAVLETEERVSQPYEIQPATTGGATFGQQVWFLGYPYGLGTLASSVQLPFIKRGTMSAIDSSNPKAILLYIDGFNNPGFSGGPIIYWDFKEHVIKILGVVKGYKEDTAKVIVNGVHVDTQLLVNSGILIGYSISHAFEAIEQGDKQPSTGH